MTNRRDFLKTMAALSAGAGFAGAVPESIARAFAIDPDPGSTFLDAEHVVILMQENRSFDHIYGSIAGVRGFNDPRAIRQANGNSVFLQTNSAGNTYVPFRLNIKDTNATWMGSIPHSRPSQVDAWNGGLYNNWVDAKKSGNSAYSAIPFTLGFYTREDVPFYYALSDAFTLCDQNYAGVMSSTTPNRTTFWTGTIRESQNSTAMANIRNENYSTASETFSTFPELMEAAGVNWKFYQNDTSYGVRNLDDTIADWTGNYGCNILEKFANYKVSTANSSLTGTTKSLNTRAFQINSADPDYHSIETVDYNDAGTTRTITVPKGDVLYQFRKDVQDGVLPTVSWLASPRNFSEHPTAPWYGTWIVSEVLNILTADPNVWKKTIFVLTYDENDGYYDHVPPFTCPNPLDATTGIATSGIDTALEYVQLAADQASLAGTGLATSEARQGPIGLGFRVAKTVVSPWSRGGYVSSSVYDHTSMLRFLEVFLSNKTGQTIKSPNISPWRRSITSDMTSCFRAYNGDALDPLPFMDRNQHVENILNAKYKPKTTNFHALSASEIASVNADAYNSGITPKQEQGIRPACANPHEFYVDAALNSAKTQIGLTMTAGTTLFGTKSAGGPFNVYSRGLTASPYMKVASYAVTAGNSLNAYANLSTFTSSIYHLSVQGPNGFYRDFVGNASDPAMTVVARQQGQSLVLTITPAATMPASTINIKDNSYATGTQTRATTAGSITPITVTLDMSASFGWYDVTVSVLGNTTFAWRYAGHLETGNASYTDPLMGGMYPSTLSSCSV